MRITFLNRFYWPDIAATGQLLADLAGALAAAGHDVTVVTSGDAGRPGQEVHDGVRIVRVRSAFRTNRSVVAKALAFVTFAAGALWRLARLTRRGDTIVVLTDPPLIGVGTWFVARLRGARILHWVQDIYPEVAMAVSGQRWLGVLAPLRNCAWRRADGVVTVGRDMAAVVKSAGVRPECVTVIPNWAPAGLAPTQSADAEVLRLRSEWQLMDKFVVAYSGNLGRVHDLDPVIAAAELLNAEPSVAFVFIGGGPQRDALVAAAERRGLTNVRFEPAQSRDALGTVLAVADVHLVTLRPGCERFVFPSKFYGIMAAERPVLFVGNTHCELAHLVQERGLGRVVDRDRPADIAAAVRDLASDPQATTRYAQATRPFAREHCPERAFTAWQQVLLATRTC